MPVGFAMMVEMGSSNTLIQTMSPDHLRGRVMSVYSMMFMGMAPLGAVLSGVTAGPFGAPADHRRRRRHLHGGGRRLRLALAGIADGRAPADRRGADGRRRASTERHRRQPGGEVRS